MLLTVVDYGVGNLRSIAKSIEKANSDSKLNYSIKVSSDINDIKKSDKIVLPGQGSFKACKNGINNIKGMLDELNEGVLVKKKPIYGICAGMQLFATKGYEEEETNGLNWIPGVVAKLDIGKTNFKIPHMGWNNLQIQDNHPILENITESEQFYFVHSYVLESKQSDQIIANTNYNQKIPAIIGKDNYIGVQFHPEKSGNVGQKFIYNWLKWKL